MEGIMLWRRMPGLLLGLITAFLFTLSPLMAGIKNKGSDSVPLEFRRTSGISSRITIYPGQSINIPDGTTHITLPERMTRGDELIEVEIVESNNKMGTLTKYGQVYELGLPEELDLAIKYANGRATNNSNIILEVRMKEDTGYERRLNLYPEDSIVIPMNVKTFKLDTPRPLRGDERINVDVTMPDGSVYLLTGAATLKTIEPDAG